LEVTFNKILAIIEGLILGVSLMEVGLLQNECFRKSLLKNDKYRRELKQSEDNTQIYVRNLGHTILLHPPSPRTTDTTFCTRLNSACLVFRSMLHAVHNGGIMASAL